MTDRTLPHASTVTNAAITELTMHGEQKLANQLAGIQRATCDLVHAVWAERNAGTPLEKTDAGFRVGEALARLHGPA